MKYNDIVLAEFVDRPNRFIAKCIINGKEEVVHVKNTGRCRELLIPGTKVYVQYHDNPKRKTRYSLIGVYKKERLINMDSQIPNYVVYEAIKEGNLILPGYEGKKVNVKPEQKYGQSRFDALVEAEGQQGYIEVKGVTLEEDGVVRFPDAPTVRGVKHVEELIAAVEEGYRGYIIFVIQMKKVKYFTPNIATHPEFGEALKKAEEKGVHVLAYDCNVTADEIRLNSPIDVKL